MAINLWDQEYNDIIMFKILHASADYFLCSFEFEDQKTWEHVFADYFDDKEFYERVCAEMAKSMYLNLKN